MKSSKMSKGGNASKNVENHCFKSFFGALWGSENLQFFGLTVKLVKAANLLVQVSRPRKCKPF